MSKLSFRARQLDAYKSMHVYHSEELPDVADVAAINRAVPQMPTGMEKEEESEHHLQRALSAQQVYGSAEVLVIPIPEIEDLKSEYDKIYSTDYKLPKTYIHAQSYGIDQDLPDYDMDSEDEAWLDEQTKKLDITPLKFEEMLDRLEKGSGQQVVTLQEAKLLLKEDDDLIITIYDYWLNKRLKHTNHALIPTVKTEKRDGSTTNNPYVAFRRRTEKMQTRKNRKNDEVSYEKMLKLRRDLQRAVTMLEMIKKREKCKKELLQLTLEILDKRYEMEDFSGNNLAHAEAQKAHRPVFYPLYEQYSKEAPEMTRKQKRKYEKKKHKAGSVQYQNTDVDVMDYGSTEEETQSTNMSLSDHEEESHPDGIYAFRRKKFCNYHAPLENGGNWPWTSPSSGGYADKRFRYTLSTVDAGPETVRCVGYARRRRGRGGRIIFDRAYTEQRSDFWDRVMDTTVKNSNCSSVTSGDKNSNTSSSATIQSDTSETTFRDYVHNNKWLHFAPYEEYDSTNALFNGSLVDLASNSLDTNDNDIDPLEGIPSSDSTLLGNVSTTGSSGFIPIVTAASNALQSDDIIHPLPTVSKKQLIGSVGPNGVANHQQGNINSSTTIISNNDSKVFMNTSTGYVSNSGSGNSLSLLSADQNSYDSHQRNLSVLKKELQDQSAKKSLQGTTLGTSNSLPSLVNCNHNSVVDSKKATYALSALVNGKTPGKGNGINHINGPNILRTISSLPGDNGDSNKVHHTVITTDNSIDFTDSAGLNSIPDVANTMEVT